MVRESGGLWELDGASHGCIMGMSNFKSFDWKACTYQLSPSLDTPPQQLLRLFSLLSEHFYYL